MEEHSLPLPADIDLLATKLAQAQAKGNNLEELRWLGYLAAAYAEAGQFPEATSTIALAIPMLSEYGNSALLDQVLGYVTESLLQQGKTQEAIPYLEHYFGLLESVEDLSAKAACAAMLGRLYFDRGQPLKAISYLKKGAYWSYRVGQLDGSSRCYTKAALAHVELGQLSDAGSCLCHALVAASASGNIRHQAQIYNNLAVVCTRLDLDDAENYYQAACRLAEASKGAIAYPALILGDISEAVEAGIVG